MLSTPTRRLADIECFEIGSDGAKPWRGRRAELLNDLAALKALDRRRLVHVEEAGDIVEIRGTTHVGLIVLPSGRRLVIRSKVPGLTLLEWLAYLGEFQTLARWMTEQGVAAQQTEQDDWHRCIGRLFLFALEDVTRWHLRKGYAALTIDSTEIRGRIIATRLLQRLNRLPRVPQIKRYRTYDVAYNAVLAKALDRVPLLLADGCAADRRRLAWLREQWSLIDRGIDEPIAAVRAAQWACPPGYQAALQLARLILIGAAIDPQSNMGGQAFTVSLATVWERALRRMCGKLADTGWERLPDAERTRHWDDPAGRGDSARWLTADVILQKGDRRWVLDAKYKRDFGNESRNDRFQMCAYAIAFDASRVSLVYPTATTQVAFHHTLLRTSFRYRPQLIDSIALPMAKGPEACLQRLSHLMTDSVPGA